MLEKIRKAANVRFFMITRHLKMSESARGVEGGTRVADAQILIKRSGSHREAAHRRIVHAVDVFTNVPDTRDRYKNINYNEEIRVLKVTQARLGHRFFVVLCLLFDQTLHIAGSAREPTAYAALSYYWGSDEPGHESFMFENGEDYEQWRQTDTPAALETSLTSCLLIQDNLKNALKHLQSEIETVVL